MQTSRIRLVTRALALLVGSSLLTTCGDDSSSSKEDRGVFGEMADVLMQAEADYLTANAEIFASAEYMEPFIAELLNSSTLNAVQSTAQTSCLPEGVGGRTYTINGTPFTSVPDTAVPEYTARFRLFRLSTASEPLLNQEIGYVDYTCVDVGVPVTEVLIASDTVIIASITFSQQSGNITGLIRTPDGSASLDFNGRLYLNAGLLLTVTFSPNDLEANYESPLAESGARYADIFIRIPPDTDLKGEVYVDGQDQVTEGTMWYREGGEYSLAACIQSGTLSSPALSSPSTDCYHGENEIELVPVNNAQVAAMSDSYQLLRHFWLAAANLVTICRSLVPDDK